MIVSLRDAYVSGELAMAFDGMVSYFAGGSTGGKDSVRFPCQRLGGKAVELDDVVVINHKWGLNGCKLINRHSGRGLTLVVFHHFLIQDLPRIGIVYDYLMANPQVKILAHPSRYPIDYYEMIGIRRDRIVFYDENTLYHAKKYGVAADAYVGRTLRCPAADSIQLHLLGLLNNTARSNRTFSG
jgi:hypothetical protein